MNLPVLLACACPTFEETEVVARVPGSQAQVRHVESVLAFFAGWTLRDGVCVAEVAIQEGVVLVGSDGVPRSVASAYDPARRAIVVDRDGDIAIDTLHELCHALDEQEGLSKSAAELFPPEAVPADPLHPTRPSRAREGFANACAGGPRDRSLEFSLEDACGLDGVDERSRFLAEVVYPGVLTTYPPFGEPVAWDPVERSLGEGVLLDVTRQDDALVVLFRARSGGRLPEPGLLVLREDAEPTWHPLPDPARDDFDPELLEADAGVWVEVPGGSGRLYTWDGKTFEARTMPTLDDEWMVAGAVSEGVVYAAVATPSTTGIRALHVESGLVADLPSAPTLSPFTSFGNELWPVEGGVELASGGSVFRYVGGAWTERSPETPVSGVAAVNGATRTFARNGGSFGMALLDLDMGSGELTAHPVCAPGHSYARIVPGRGGTEPWLVVAAETTRGHTLVRYGPLTR